MFHHTPRRGGNAVRDLALAGLLATAALGAVSATTHAQDGSKDRGPCLIWTSGVSRTTYTPDGETNTVSTWCDQYAEYGPSDAPDDPKPGGPDDPNGPGGIDTKEPQSKEELCKGLATQIQDMEAAYRYALDNVAALEIAVANEQDKSDKLGADYATAAARHAAASAATAAAKSLYDDAGLDTTVEHVHNGTTVVVTVGYNINTAEGRAVIRAMAAERAARDAEHAAFLAWRSSDPASSANGRELAAVRNVLQNGPAQIESARRQYRANCG